MAPRGARPEARWMSRARKFCESAGTLASVRARVPLHVHAAEKGERRGGWWFYAGEGWKELRVHACLSPADTQSGMVEGGI
eukprot:5494523-Lingulodinium_polyedra.AAC.1